MHVAVGWPTSNIGPEKDIAAPKVDSIHCYLNGRGNVVGVSYQNMMRGTAISARRLWSLHDIKVRLMSPKQRLGNTDQCDLVGRRRGDDRP
jgi:hypothetical protein